jgi:RNA polymerase sigma-70 factor (ECF subfamily)
MVLTLLISRRWFRSHLELNRKPLDGREVFSGRNLPISRRKLEDCPEISLRASVNCRREDFWFVFQDRPHQEAKAKELLSRSSFSSPERSDSTSVPSSWLKNASLGRFSCKLFLGLLWTFGCNTRLLDNGNSAARSSISRVMNVRSGDNNDLLGQAQAGDQLALGELFSRYRDRLRQMVHVRLDRRLQGRIDPSDVLQEAFLDVSKRLGEYVQNPDMPFYLWLRYLTGQKLVDLHRYHLGVKMRNAGQEVSLYRGALPQASSISLAAQLLGRLTSASRAAMRAETQIRVQEALNSMDAMDREVLTLRHFEMLSNDETAQVLGLSKTAASNRYLRALKRLKGVLSAVPGWEGL